MANRKHSDFETLQASCPACDRQAMDDAERAGQRFATLTNVGMALAGAAAAGALTLYFVESSSDTSERRAHVKLGIRPGMLSLSGAL